MASRTVQSSIIDPGLQTLTDPALQNNIRQGLGSAASSAQRLALDANGFVRDRAGVDLAGQLSSLSVGGGGYHNANETRGGGNEEFFSGLGSRNAGRRDDLPPNQGGKYSGFGSNSGGKGGYKDDEGDDFMAVRLACPPPPFLTSLITSALSLGLRRRAVAFWFPSGDQEDYDCAQRARSCCIQEKGRLGRF